MKKSLQDELDFRAQVKEDTRENNSPKGSKKSLQLTLDIRAGIAKPLQETARQKELREIKEKLEDIGEGIEQYKKGLPKKPINNGTLIENLQKDLDAIAGSENDVVILKESYAENDFTDLVSLKEAEYNSDEIKVVLIESGVNLSKKRYYPDKTLREAAPKFAELKMYINHPTSIEEKQNPGRDLRDWVGTITESYYKDGKVFGKVAVHDPWLKERLADSIARKAIGLSINTGGRVSLGKIDGKEIDIVEEIIFNRLNRPVSVDFVTDAGAGGRILN